MEIISKINNEIMSGDFTNEQLTSVIDAVKYARAQLARRTKRTLTIGATVEWYSERRGVRGRGVVEKISIKNVLVREGSMRWKIPANMLEAV
jgi:hypothetical protein